MSFWGSIWDGVKGAVSGLIGLDGDDISGDTGDTNVTIDMPTTPTIDPLYIIGGIVLFVFGIIAVAIISK